MVNLGQRIKQIRERLGFNQAEFARQLGFESPMSISYYEKEKRDPDLNTLVKIANMGKVDLNWLLTGEAPQAAIKRIFYYNSIELEDPDSALSPEEVKKFYSDGYPELSQSDIEGPEITKTAIVYKFVKKIGIKGADISAMAEPGAIYAIKDAQMNEIVELLKENPGDKKLVLKLLKGKKDIKEALEGFGIKGLVEES